MKLEPGVKQEPITTSSSSSSSRSVQEQLEEERRARELQQQRSTVESQRDMRERAKAERRLEEDREEAKRCERTQLDRALASTGRWALCSPLSLVYHNDTHIALFLLCPFHCCLCAAQMMSSPLWSIRGLDRLSITQRVISYEVIMREDIWRV